MTTTTMMVASLSCRTLALLIICMALQEGCGLPLSEREELPAQPPPHPRHVRAKRCSCNSWEDKECIYFCHLDIIWVNTPSKLLPYGLGNPTSRRRRRRSADRCQCLDAADETCLGFCRSSAENPKADAVEESATNGELLASFRSTVRSNLVMAKAMLSPRSP